MKRVVLLGSTGSVGTSTCKVAQDLPVNSSVERASLHGLRPGPPILQRLLLANAVPPTDDIAVTLPRQV